MEFNRSLFLTLRLYSTVSTAALLLAMSPAQAQSAADATAAPEEVTVTATRVDREGYNAPTPTTVVGLDLIQSKAPANLADLINEMPSLTASNSNRTQNAAGASVQGQGQNLLNLRDLGPNRTLVLLDGARAMPSNATLNIDIDLLPSELVQRIDVVTGGASADWGSDAVAGVVNFVLDKNYNGFKGYLQGGETRYGDGQNGQAALTYGTELFDGKGHFEISGKYSYQAQVGGAVPSGRTWYQGYKILANPNGSATNILLPKVGLSSATDGGLITAGGSLKGTQFVGTAGTIAPFNFGSVSGQESVNGTAEDDGGRIQLENPQYEGNIFARGSYDITDTITGFVDLTYARSTLQLQSVPYNRLGNITILSGNAYLPTSIQTAMTTAKLASFTLGKVNQQLGFTLLHNDSEVANIKAGLTGSFGDGWNWDVYYQHGRNTTLAQTHNDGIIANYNAAVDAVVNPASGQIVCRTTLAAPANGCQPFNPFGTAPVSAAVQNYVTGTGTQSTGITQDNAAINLRGSPFSTAAGPVSIATGLEYRNEHYVVGTDALSQANAFFIDYGTPASGSFSVTEGYIETVVPVLSGHSWAKEVDLNGAVRVAGYSLSGLATTWKVGMTWEASDELLLRVSRSTDIRAPNLQDLFATGITTQVSLNDPGHGGYQMSSVTSGNTNLVPEVANTTSGGAVFKPDAIPGLTASVDYFGINVHNAITTPAAQVIINQCSVGNAQACLTITRGSNGLISNIAIAPLNIQGETTAGIDYSVSYRTALSDLNSSLNGAMTVKLLITDTMDHTTSLLGAVTQFAGTNGDGQYADPRWRGLMSATYDLDALSATLSAHYISSGVITNRTPAIVNNGVPGIYYLDLSGSYQVQDNIQIYGVIDNLFDKDPPPTPQLTVTPHLNIGADNYIYDTIGRQFRAGVRFQL